MGNNNIRRIVLILAVLVAFCAMLWYFTDIFVYMFVALILSVIGSPLVKLLQKIHIGKHRLPDSVAAGITLVAIVAVIGTLINMVIPLISYEIRQLQSIDLTAMLDNLEKASRQVEQWLRHKHLPIAGAGTYEPEARNARIQSFGPHRQPVGDPHFREPCPR